MNVEEFFPHQVCINLDTRPDRWERMTARFLEHGINRVVRFPAVNGNQVEIPSAWRYSPGAYGCLRSHLAVIEQARDEARPSVLIFEDDTVLAPDFNPQFARYVEQLPDEWDMIFFGGLHGQPVTKVADNLLRINHSLSTYAYALKHTIYDSFIELNRQALTVLDENTRALQKRFNCYCFTPHLAWVEGDYSDVRGERINLWWLKESLVIFGPEIDEVISDTVAIIFHRNDSPESLRNLIFMTDHLSEGLPGIAILVLAHGAESRVNRSDLSPDCHLDIVKDFGCPCLSLALQRASDLLEIDKEFFIFLDSDLFITREDIRANLLKCRDYDFASSFYEICDLDERDTLRILNGDVRWDYNGDHPSRGKTALCDSGFIITRKGLRILSECEESDRRSEERMSMRVKESLRVYDSPNPARRLSSPRSRIAP